MAVLKDLSEETGSRTWTLTGEDCVTDCGLLNYASKITGCTQAHALPEQRTDPHARSLKAAMEGGKEFTLRAYCASCRGGPLHRQVKMRCREGGDLPMVTRKENGQARTRAPAFCSRSPNLPIGRSLSLGHPSPELHVLRFGAPGAISNVCSSQSQNDSPPWGIPWHPAPELL